MSADTAKYPLGSKIARSGELLGWRELKETLMFESFQLLSPPRVTQARLAYLQAEGYWILSLRTVYLESDDVKGATAPTY